MNLSPRTENLMAESLPAAPEQASERLRHATRDQHRRIERVRCLGRLFAKNYGLEEYRRLLERLYGFYAAVEPRLAATFNGMADTPFRRPAKAPLLADDLASLGLSRKELDGLPLCDDLPEAFTAEDAIGAAYVLEGSTQGGVLIRKQLIGHFGEEIRNALRFYTAYGDNTAAMWRDFKAALDARYGVEPARIPALVDAANATFNRLTEWFEEAPEEDGRNSTP